MVNSPAGATTISGHSAQSLKFCCAAPTDPAVVLGASLQPATNRPAANTAEIAITAFMMSSFVLAPPN
jgi:hypothetical protein